MIEFPNIHMDQASPLLRVIGVGNAGVHLADQVALQAIPGIEVIAMNTDAQSLSASVCPRKAALGPRTTRGLGAGGDPELGYEAARESIEEIRFAVGGASAIILLAGLGGGTASGVTQLIAETARSEGVFVVALVTAPFNFEGRRRTLQAAEAERLISQHAHAVLRFENDRMAELTSPLGGVSETFANSDATLSSCVEAILEMLTGRGPMPLHIGSLLGALQGLDSSAVFGRGESLGDNRAYEALEVAMKGTLMDRGRLLSSAQRVVAHISGPPDLSFSEVAAIMRELAKHTSDHAQLYLGVAAGTSEHTPLAVTILATCSAEQAKQVIERKPEPRAQIPVEAIPSEANQSSTEEIAPTHLTIPDPEPPPQPTPAAKPLSVPVSARSPKRPTSSRKQKATQETLPLDNVNRGRFEKSEPTIVEGEDLDVPTFLRTREKPS